MQTVSHNIANAETEGYSRQRAEMVPALPQRFGYGSVGTGVEIKNIVRLRDTMLDANYRREAANAEGTGLRRDVLSQIEAVFGEPSDKALSSSLDAFWSSWSDLANNPRAAGAQAFQAAPVRGPALRKAKGCHAPLPHDRVYSP